MKKIFLLAYVALAMYTYVLAQCTPVALTSPGFIPMALGDAVATQPYDQTISVKWITDTTVYSTKVTVTSVTLSSITGLPAGLTYTTDKTPTHTWAGGDLGCINISGTVAKEDIGNYPIVLKMVLNGFVPYDVTYFSINVKDYVQSITKSIDYELELNQNYPNPFDTKTSISFTTPVAGEYDVTIMNMVGSVVFNEKINARVGLNKVNFERDNLMAGMYFYKLSDGKNTITKRMIIKD